MSFTIGIPTWLIWTLGVFVGIFAIGCMALVVYWLISYSQVNW